jgi:alkyl hydroperoxide reductase subunit AhpF
MFEENLVDPVRMVYFTIPTSPLVVPGRESCETCDDVQQLVEEVAGISDKLSVEVHHFERERELAQKYGVTRVPALVLATGDEARVRYFGAPAGYEFMTLLQDLQNISKRQTALSQPTRDALAAITDPIHIQVFVTPT